MFHKYFRFNKKRIFVFLSVMAIIIGIQFFLTGSLLSRQKVTTEAGNSESAVIGILDKTEVVRQKFKFNRKVVLKEFSLSFGSFERKEVGDDLKIQLMDGDNNIVFETTVPVDKITPNASYRIPMDYTVTIPKGVTCCLKITCSSKDNPYETVPTLNTTNRTDPNTYMSTLQMQTKKKCLNISYTYYYRQFAPTIIYCIEIVLLFILCFERVTEYGVLLRKKKQKATKKQKKQNVLEEKAKEQREKSRSTSAKIKYSKSKNTKIKKKNLLNKNKTKQQRTKNTSKSVKDIVKWCLVEPKFILWVRRVVVVINPLLIMFMVELLNDALLTKSAWVWIFTVILIFALELFFYVFLGNIYYAIIVLDCILFPAGIANFVLMNIRGTPFLPGDLLALGTAAEVAGTYTISLAPMQFVMLPAFLLWCLFVLRIKPKKEKLSLKKQLIKRAVPIASSCLIIGGLYNTSILQTFKIEDNVWNKVSSCRTNGFYLNFFINLHYLSVSKPAGYSQEEVKNIITEVKKESKAETKTTNNEIKTNKDFSSVTSLNGKKPNIILIMNESLADYSLIANPNFNEDPLPYLHSLKENTIYGKDYVSIYGAGTSNSEFEAMTGNSMTFFPSGSNVYQQFMHDTTFSLPYYLKSLGYTTQAIHPSSGANWNRIKTYESMRFDKFTTIDDFENPEYVRYISDKESYKKVIELYEEKEDDTPFFAFDMTIQNHGGYLTNTNWKDEICVKGSYYPETKEFLSATRVSDNAFKYLVDYFKKQEEPTIICMFGDHQPSIETAFYEEIMEKPQSEWDLEDIQKRYVTPFVIWANYDIEESTNAVISNNYLENLLLKQAGIDLPLYNQFIENVSKEIPAMNVNGYMDFDGKWYNYDDEESPEIQKILKDYEILQYGYYSDSDKDTMRKIFQIKK